MYEKIFMRTLPFFSRSLHNVERDWNKVGKYARHLQVVGEGFDIASCYTNQFLPETPHADVKAIACCIED